VKKLALVLAFAVVACSAVMAQTTTYETKVSFHNFQWGTSPKG